ncbi:MAG TPA: hypothetical protein VM680_08035 [Verrucomicrobiae bacterium]|nr:hypothetical protein [Verrucomicrobiae bacterium]
MIEQPAAPYQIELSRAKNRKQACDDDDNARERHERTKLLSPLLFNRRVFANADYSRTGENEVRAHANAEQDINDLASAHYG